MCEKHNVIILSDEVYERVVFDENEHVRIGSLPGVYIQLFLSFRNSNSFIKFLDEFVVL